MGRISPYPPLLTRAGINAHPTPENKKKAVDILAAVSNVGSETNTDNQIEVSTSIVTSMSED